MTNPNVPLPQVPLPPSAPSPNVYQPRQTRQPAPAVPQPPMPGRPASGGAGAQGGAQGAPAATPFTAPAPAGDPVQGGARPQMPPMPAGSVPAAPAPAGPAMGGNGPMAPQGDGGIPSASGAKSAVLGRKPFALVAAVVAVALVVAGGLAVLLTYRFEVWGGKTLPDPASIASEVKDADGKKSSVVKAKDVTAALEAKGLKTRTEKVFSGKATGSFVGYSGAKQGERVKAGSTVTVRESAGPGVPKDTVGKRAEKVVDTLADMGVPVHYKRIVVSDTKKTPEGTVMATYPNPGQGVAKDKMEDGIYVGVATKGEGVGADIVGKDVDETRAALEEQGYAVTVTKRFSSKQNIGKVAGSDPAPGSAVQSGGTITLYQGIGADDVHDLLIDGTKNPGYHTIFYLPEAMAGTYCKATVKDATKDCMTFVAGKDSYGDTEMYQQWGEASGASASAGSSSKPDGTLMNSCFSTNGGDIGRCSVSIDGFGGGSSMSGSAANRLVAKDWGMFDFGAGGEGATCGADIITTWWQSCVNGVASFDQPRGWDGSATYDMHDFFVYAAAGADLKSAESSGYFDGDAVKTAQASKAVDADRPFILYRDPKQYDNTSVKVTDANAHNNPFIPSSAESDDSDVKFKPAPSDANAYYLVESGDYDWQSLPDAKVDGGAAKSDTNGKTSGDSGTSSKQSDKKPAKTAKDMSLPEIRASLDGGDFTPIAGKYCKKDNTVCLTIDKNGKATSSGSQGYTLNSDGGNTVTLHAATDADNWWDVPEDVGIELMGPDSDYRCGGQTGADACYGSGKSYSEAEIAKPTDMIYVPAGVSSDKFEGLAKSSYDFVPGEAKPDSSKAFIKLEAYHMNVPPTDSNVLYFVE